MLTFASPFLQVGGEAFSYHGINESVTRRCVSIGKEKEREGVESGNWGVNYAHLWLFSLPSINYISPPKYPHNDYNSWKKARLAVYLISES